jgi:hypothetical protein
MEINSMGRLDKALEKAAAISGAVKDAAPETIIITDRNEPVDKRKHKRYSKRLKVRMSSGNLRRSGIMKNVSKNGMFIMSSKEFTENMAINIELPLSNNKTSFLNGIITRNMGIPESNWLIGAGIKLTEKDETFHNFLTTLS